VDDATKVTDQTGGGHIFIRAVDIEAIDAQTVRIVLWIDLPTGERRIFVRIASATSVAVELNLKMQQALADHQ
jgi:hypothetical protein